MTGQEVSPEARGVRSAWTAAAPSPGRWPHRERAGLNGDPLYHWMAPAVSTALVPPMSVAVLAGWAPPWLRKRQAGMRLRAYGSLCCHAFVLLDVVPRIADASYGTVMACANAGFASVAAAAVLFLLSERKDKAAREAGRVGPARPQHQGRLQGPTSSTAPSPLRRSARGSGRDPPTSLSFLAGRRGRSSGAAAVAD